MKPAEAHVYDAYPMLVNAVIGTARHLAQLPIDAMGGVLDRVGAAGCYTSQGHTQPVDADVVARHRRLVEAAQAFRDAVVDAVTMPAGTDW